MSKLTYYDSKQKQYIRLASRLAVDNKLGKLEDLEEQLGCSLEIRLQVVHNTFIYDAEGNEYVVEFVEKDFFSVYNIFYMSFRWSDYKNTWFLKKDKSE